MNKVYIKLLLFTLVGCGTIGVDQDDLRGGDYRLFMKTPVWKAAQAIAKGDTNEVRLFFEKNPNLIDYQEGKFGKSLLNWAVYAHNYAGAEVLTGLGADPNLPDNDSTTAVVYAAANLYTSDYLRLLIPKGGDVNFVVNKNGSGINGTPLIAAAWCSLESTKLLIEAGAEVNYIWQKGNRENTALRAAFNGGKIEIIHYLILETSVDYRRHLNIRLDGDSVFIGDELRLFPFKEGTKQRKLKMEIVEFLEKNGIDYWSTPIPPRFYKLYDKKFLERY